jgi:hypothetical protein
VLLLRRLSWAFSSLFFSYKNRTPEATCAYVAYKAKQNPHARLSAVIIMSRPYALRSRSRSRTVFVQYIGTGDYLTKPEHSKD